MINLDGDVVSRLAAAHRPDEVVARDPAVRQRIDEVGVRVTRKIERRQRVDAVRRNYGR